MYFLYTENNVREKEREAENIMCQGKKEKGTAQNAPLFFKASLLYLHNILDPYPSAYVTLSAYQKKEKKNNSKKC